MTDTVHPLSRRAFVGGGSLLLLTTAAAGRVLALQRPSRRLCIGLVTDLHHADKPALATRHYRDTATKLAEAARQFAADAPDLVVELGDFIDAADSVDTELRYLDEIGKVFSTMPGSKHYVLGNHCVDLLTKDEFLAGVGQRESFYSFDAGGFHFVVLDACFRSDGTAYGRKNSTWTDANVPAVELEWLEADLRANHHPTIVFAHQRLDEAGQHAVRNAAQVRTVLERHDNVQAVFQGHSHKNDYQAIGGIHYCTLVAMVEGAGPENNGYSLLDLYDDHTIRVRGFRKQAPYEWPA